MNLHHIPWATILWGIVKLLKVFGIIPGAIAAMSIQKLYQKWRQNRAIAGWPSTEARILSGEVHHEGPRRIWAELTYSYYAQEYRAGKYIHRFRKEEDADNFIREIKDRRVQVRYNESKPDESVILDRDIQMLALMAPQIG